MLVTINNTNTFFSELMVNHLSVKIVPISSYVVMNITDLY